MSNRIMKQRDARSDGRKAANAPKAAPSKTDSKVGNKVNGKTTTKKNEKAKSRPTDMVTLTQAEFDNILDTIGKLAMKTADQDIDPAIVHSKQIPNQDLRYQTEIRGKESHGNYSDNDFMQADKPRFNETSQNNTNQGSSPTKTPLHKSQMTLAERKRLEWQQENAEKAGKEGGRILRQDSEHKDQSPRYFGQDINKNTSLNAGNNFNQTQVVTNRPPPIPPTNLTAAEKKRRQWEQERAEQNNLGDYNPWGRAGAGAPIKDPAGNAINDYTRREELIRSSRMEFPALDLSSHRVYEPTSGIQKSKSQPDKMNHEYYPAELQPSAIRSSFAIGAVAPDNDRFTSDKQKQKNLWLADLEKQREEQKLRKEAEKRHWRDDTLERVTWMEKSIKSVPQPIQQVPEPPLSYRDKPVSIPDDVDDASKRMNSAPPANGLNYPEPDQMDSTGKSFMLGRNKFVDDVTKREQEDKRRKYQENQDYIKQQIEEREQKKRAEKEQRLREEYQAEMNFNQTKPVEQTSRYKSSASPVHQQITNQQRPPLSLDKEDVEKRRVDALHQAFENARLQAEKEKHDRWLQKLKKGNHDVSKLKAGFEAKLSPRNTDRGVPAYPAMPPQNTYSAVEPTFVPGLHPEPPSGTTTLQHDEYDQWMRRGLEDQHANLREFGTQTADIGLKLLEDMSRESSGIEYRPPTNNPPERVPKKVRVVSAPKDPRTGKVIPVNVTSTKTPGKVNPGNPRQRPTWGYKNPERKRPVKQSEKDAFYDQRTQKRLERQQKLMEQMAKNTGLIPGSRLSNTQTRHADDYEIADPINVPAYETASRSKTNKIERDNNNHARRQVGSEDDYSEVANRTPSLQHNRSPSVRQNVQEAPANVYRSPPVPALKHRRDSEYDANDAPSHRRGGPSTDDRYRDTPVAHQTDFVPFVRSSNILNPAHAESPLPVSREPTDMVRARQAYQGLLNPAKYGQPMDSEGGRMYSKDPMINPHIKDHPTIRQSQILQNLSDLRQALKDRQRQLANTSDVGPYDRFDRNSAMMTPVYD